MAGSQTREDIRDSHDHMIETHKKFRDNAEKLRDAVSVSQLYEEHKMEQRLRDSAHPILIDRFQADQELDNIIREYNQLCSKSVTFNFDQFPADEVSLVRDRLDQIEREYGDKLRTYLAPYTVIPEIRDAEDYFRWSANKLLNLSASDV